MAEQCFTFRNLLIRGETSAILFVDFKVQQLGVFAVPLGEPSSSTVALGTPGALRDQPLILIFDDNVVVTSIGVFIGVAIPPSTGAAPALIEEVDPFAPVA